MVEIESVFTAAARDVRSVLNVVCRGVMAFSELVKMVVACAAWAVVSVRSFVSRATRFATIVAVSGGVDEVRSPNGPCAIIVVASRVPSAVTLNKLVSMVVLLLFLLLLFTKWN